jgi:hypothetical protein
VVSDMLEHGPEYSQYRGPLDFEALRSAPYYRRVRTDLQDVEVEIFYIRRNGAEGIQGARHVEFWQDFFIDQGATLIRVVSIQG